MSQRGNSRMGCVVSIALAGLFLYGSFKAVPVYLAKIEFQEGMDKAVSRSGAMAKSAKQLENEIKRIAEFHEFEIVPGSLRSERRASITGPPELRVQVSCYRDIEFPGYTYRYIFSSRASTFVGGL